MPADLYSLTIHVLEDSTGCKYASDMGNGPELTLTCEW